MAWKSVIPLEKRGRRAVGPRAMLIRRSGNPPRVLTLLLGETLCQNLNWALGDQVTIVKDEKCNLGLKKVSMGGNNLTPATRVKGELKPQWEGSVRRSLVHFTCDEEVAALFADINGSKIIESPEVRGSVILIYKAST